MNMLKLFLTVYLVILSQNTLAAKTATVKAQSASEQKLLANSNVTGNYLPVILWGGDLTAIQAGYNIHLQNDIVAQINDVKSGKTPYFRGTIGQAIYASDALCEKGEKCLVWVYKYSDSTGGDGLKVKKGINNFSDLCGKKVGLQLAGPHMDLASTLNTLADCQKSNPIQFVWYKDLGLDSKTKESAVNAFINGELDAAFGITVDLKSDDTKAVQGANILVTTSTLRSSISDHVWVTKEYSDAHPDEITKLAHDLLVANEKTHELTKQNSKDWLKLKEKGAEILFEAPNDPNFISAIGDMYLYDLTMAGWTGNYKFATCDAGSGKKEANCLESQLAEVSKNLNEMGVLKNPNRALQITAFKHNWDSLKSGLSETFGVEVQSFNQTDVNRIISKLTNEGHLDDGIVKITAFFEANQNDFSQDLYASEFEKALLLMEKAGGSISTITAHADPSKYLLEKFGTSILPANFPKQLRDQMQAQYGNGIDSTIWKKTLQAAQDSSQRRANAMLEALKTHVENKKINISFENVQPQGDGVRNPVNGTCTYSYKGQQIQEPCFPSSSEIVKQNRRVIFSAHNVDGEIELTSGVKW